jgi:hypothetical protein
MIVHVFVLVLDWKTKKSTRTKDEDETWGNGAMG